MRGLFYAVCLPGLIVVFLSCNRKIPTLDSPPSKSNFQNDSQLEEKKNEFKGGDLKNLDDEDSSKSMEEGEEGSIDD